MIIFHHNDLDGKVAAQLLFLEIKRKFPDGNVRFVEYNYASDFPIEKVDKNEIVFIVDLSFTGHTINTLKMLVDYYHCTVIWLDHHKSSIDLLHTHGAILDSLSNNRKPDSGELIKFVDSSYCGAVNTYFFIKAYNKYFDYNGLMNIRSVLSVRKNTSTNILNMMEYYRYINLEFDNKESFSDNSLSDCEDSVFIGDCLYYIDQWDSWKHNDSNSEEVISFKYYTDSINMEVGSTSGEFNDICNNILNPDYTNNFLKNILKSGKVIYEYDKNHNKELLDSYSFEFNINGINTLCMNGYGSSLVFGDKFNDYNMVCLFRYNGRLNKYTYSIYSKKDGANCQQIAESFGGGGHLHAAGFSTDKLIFTNTVLYNDRNPTQSSDIINKVDNKPDYNKDFNNKSIWINKPNMNRVRYGHSTCGISNNALATGGRDDNTTELFNSNTWTNSTNMNSLRAFHSTVGISNNALATGGIDIISTELNTTELFNGSTWTNSINMNSNRYLHSTVGISNNALATGGYNGSTSLNTTELFNGSTWTNSINMNSIRYNHSTVGVSNNVLATGGVNTVYLNTTELFNGNIWTNSINMNSNRYIHSTVGISNNALATGGNNDNGDTLNTTELFNGTIWTNSTNMNSIRNRHSTCGISNNALATGGYNGNILNTTELFIETKDK